MVEYKDAESCKVTWICTDIESQFDVIKEQQAQIEKLRSRIDKAENYLNKAYKVGRYLKYHTDYVIAAHEILKGGDDA